MPVGRAHGPPPGVALPDRLGDRAEGNRPVSAGPGQVVVVAVWAAGPGLKPFSFETEPGGELMKGFRGVCLEVSTTGPEAPVPGHKRIVDVDPRRVAGEFAHSL